MSLAATARPTDRWTELAAAARSRARRANARAAATEYPQVAARFEREAELNIAAAHNWARFAERKTV